MAARSSRPLPVRADRVATAGAEGAVCPEVGAAHAGAPMPVFSRRKARTAQRAETAAMVVPVQAATAALRTLSFSRVNDQRRLAPFLAPVPQAQEGSEVPRA
jgi:hypothetical protein